MHNLIDDQIINEDKIKELLIPRQVSREEVDGILTKAGELHGLTLSEVATLLLTEDPQVTFQLLDLAATIKEKIYGQRTVIFAPLYLTNECVNDCLYCGFRSSNGEMERKTLSIEEIVSEAKALEAQGYKRLLLVCGEHPHKSNIDYITAAIKEIYEHTDIRRVSINAAPMSVEAYTKLHEAGIGVYQLFQETYHRATYEHVHPVGYKADYSLRIKALDKALAGGNEDLGMGVLFGLYDYRFDLLALLAHVKYLEATFGIGPHTISIPRLRPAFGAEPVNSQYLVSDDTLKKIVAVFRCAVPYTGLVLSTREPASLRDELIKYGISQISAGSSTSPGGYRDKNAKPAAQFSIDDDRNLAEMVNYLCESGNLPSFCTACYRQRRTGAAFQNLAKPGHVQDFCLPNALLTFQEYLLDFAERDVIAKGQEIINNHLAQIPNDGLRQQTKARLEDLQQGQRDLYF